MEMLIAVTAVIGVAGLLMWVGELTGRDNLKLLAMLMLLVGLPLVAGMFGGGGGGLESADFYRR